MKVIIPGKKTKNKTTPLIFHQYSFHRGSKVFLRCQWGKPRGKNDPKRHTVHQEMRGRTNTAAAEHYVMSRRSTEKGRRHGAAEQPALTQHNHAHIHHFSPQLSRTSGHKRRVRPNGADTRMRTAARGKESRR